MVAESSDLESLELLVAQSAEDRKGVHAGRSRRMKKAMHNTELLRRGFRRRRS